jgi:hypothetical protein
MTVDIIPVDIIPVDIIPVDIIPVDIIPVDMSEVDENTWHPFFGGKRRPSEKGIVFLMRHVGKEIELYGNERLRF